MQVTSLIYIKRNLKQVMFLLKQRAMISLKSLKQSDVATSSKKSEIIALHKASHECSAAIGWNLHRKFLWIFKCFGILNNDKDNATCIAKIKVSYIKGDQIKHILVTFFHLCIGIKFKCEKNQVF